MKSSILKLSFVVCVAATGIVSCNSSTEKKEEKVNEAIADVVIASQELAQARLDSAKEYNAYKAEVEAKLIENDRNITNLKAEIKKEKKEAREKYDKELEELNKKNDKLKLNIQEYKGSVNDKWESFKNSFNRDMDELGKSISEFAKNNMKKK
jgi:chromosome segregation ATPase